MLSEETVGPFPERAHLGDAGMENCDNLLETRSAMAARCVTILFATETGASEEVARSLGQAAEQNGLQASVMDMADCNAATLSTLDVAFFVASTTGDGDAPYAAEAFFAELCSEQGDRLDHLRYAVLALGDSTYERFCAAGRRLDDALARRGASRLLPLVECDIDYDEPAAQWRIAVLGSVSAKPLVPTGEAPLQGAENARREKFPLTEAMLVDSRVITGTGSTKATRHLALAFSDPAAVVYNPGDALGVVVENDRSVVEAVLEAGRLSAGTTISLKGEAIELGEALRLYLEITTVTPRFLDEWALACGIRQLADAINGEDPGARTAMMRDYHIVDVMQAYPAQSLNAQTFADMLRSLQPRLYSIASSLRATPGQVHLTVAPVSYSLRGTDRRGVATGQLCERAPIGTKLQVYVQANAHFRLPAPDVPIVMIGAGTGVAPYRGFLQERAAQAASGGAWLFFGERNKATDFLYRDELQEFLRSGLLGRLDTAFSRDGASKIYVQQRLLENAQELCRWIEDGAHIYVCGDAANMAPDVHRALIGVLEIGMGLSVKAAEARLGALQGAGRYQRDVY